MSLIFEQFPNDESLNSLGILLNQALLNKTQLSILSQFDSNLLAEQDLFDQVDYLSKILQLTHTQQKYVKQAISTLGIELRWLDHQDHHFIPIWHALYPSLLRYIAVPPLGLYVRTKNIDVLNYPSFAFVGSRKPSKAKAAIAYNLSKDVSQRGFCIVSGLAYGIDALSHKAATDFSMPTIAVLANGLGSVYPKSHAVLAQNIIRTGGAVISELPTRTKPLPYLFPRRNRIISGLSLGLVLVEARLSSGSGITVKTAIEQNREVLVVPGQGEVHDALNSQLIDEGALCANSADDVVSSISASMNDVQIATMGNLKHRFTQQLNKAGSHSPLEKTILLALEKESMTLDQIINMALLEQQTTSGKVLSCLSRLELANAIKKIGQYYSLS